MDRFWWWEPREVPKQDLSEDKVVDNDLIVNGEHPYTAAAYFMRLQEIRMNMTC